MDETVDLCEEVRRLSRECAVSNALVKQTQAALIKLSQNVIHHVRDVDCILKDGESTDEVPMEMCIDIRNLLFAMQKWAAEAQHEATRNTEYRSDYYPTYRVARNAA